MQIGELMKALADRYPRQFTSQFFTEHWAVDFRAVLPEGPNLQEAWDRCRAGWTKTTFPRPADIAAHLPRRAEVKGAGINRKAQHDWIEAELPALLAASCRDAEVRAGRPSWWHRSFAQVICNRYLQAQWLRDKGYLSDERFAAERWKLSDDEIARCAVLGEARAPVRRVGGLTPIGGLVAAQRPARAAPSRVQTQVDGMSRDFRERQRVEMDQEVVPYDEPADTEIRG